MTPFAWIGQDLLLQVRVQPRASRNRILGMAAGRFKIALTAPPVEGAANEALRELLAREFRLAKSRIHLLRGENSREKTLQLEQPDPALSRQLLAQWSG